MTYFLIGDCNYTTQQGTTQESPGFLALLKSIDTKLAQVWSQIRPRFSLPSTSFSQSVVVRALDSSRSDGELAEWQAERHGQGS